MPVPNPGKISEGRPEGTCSVLGNGPDLSDLPVALGVVEGIMCSYDIFLSTIFLYGDDLYSSSCTVSLVDAKVSVFNESVESRCETCVMSSVHGY